MKHPWVKTMIPYAKLAVGVLVAASMTSVVIQCGAPLGGNIQGIQPFYFLAAVLICLTHRFMNAHGWVLVLWTLGQRLPMLTGNRIWQTSEACRWLPGSVWNYGSRAVQATRHNVWAVAAGASMLAELALTLAGSVAVTLCAVTVYGDSMVRLPAAFSDSWFPISAAVAAVTVAIFAVVARHRGSSQRVHAAIRTLARLRPDLRRTVALSGYYVLVCSLHGLGFYSLILATSPEAEVPILAAVGANAAAWLIGFFAIFAPGGLVVREGTLAVLLSAWLPIEQALTVAIAWRMLQILMEVVGVGLVHSPAGIQWIRQRCRSIPLVHCLARGT